MAWSGYGLVEARHPHVYIEYGRAVFHLISGKRAGERNFSFHKLLLEIFFPGGVDSFADHYKGPSPTQKDCPGMGAELRSRIPGEAWGGRLQALLLHSLMWSGVVPQQPPIRLAPASTKASANPENSTGSFKNGLSLNKPRQPRIGLCHERHHSKGFHGCDVCGIISSGPAEQLHPNASAPRACRVTRAEIVSVPFRSVRIASKVMERW